MATRQKQWTLEELHSLTDDGNKYELVRGELFVTPAPTENHEDILAWLQTIIGPYVAEQALGMVYHPRAVVRFEGSEVEPDLMVRQLRRTRETDWDGAPAPLLVVEVSSGSTRRRDHVQKRDFYLNAGIAEYWIIDPEAKNVRIVTRGAEDVVTTDQVIWSPAGASRPLSFRVGAMFEFDNLE